MSTFDEVERARESSEHVAYDAYVSTRSGGVCACGHDHGEHDEDGFCEIRRCGCSGYHLPGDEPPGAGRDSFGRPDPSTHPEYWTE